MLLDEVHNTKLSAHFGSKKMHALLSAHVCGGHRCKFLVSKFASNVRFVNVLKIAHKHPQAYWNLYPLLTEGLDLGLWILSLGCLLVQMVAMPFSPVLIV